MGYFYGYFDESGQFKDRGQKHVALCGWVFEGTPEGGNFAKEWKHELSKVKQIHRRDWGVYDNLRPSRKKLLHNLIPIIHKHAKYGCGVTVDCAAYRKFAKGELRGRLGADAWYLAFLFVLRHLAERKLTKNDYLELTFDWNHQQVIDNANRIFRDIMRKHPRLAEHMPKIGWGASVAYPGLQAADFVAYETYQESKSPFNPETHPLGAQGEMYQALTDPDSTDYKAMYFGERAFSSWVANIKNGVKYPLNKWL